VSPAAVRWAVSPRDGYCHAFDRAQADGAAERGHAEAMCGHPIAARLTVSDAPSGTVCAYCAMAVAPEVEDRIALIRSARPVVVRPVHPEGVGRWRTP